MGRRVLYDPDSAAAKAAATLVSDAFDVREVEGWRLLDGVVILADSRADDLPTSDRIRVVALVESGGPWPQRCYALLPVDVTRPILARTIQNAFADLDAAAEVTRLDRELSELNSIGIRLSAERNPDALLETILSKAREITGSDAGSLYLVEEGTGGERVLRFALAQNDSIDIPFRTTTLPLTNHSVAGHAVLSGEVVNLEDAYDLPPGSPFTINRSFDERIGYRTKSMLAVPLRTPQGETLGALQLINCKPDFARNVRGKEGIERYVTAYSSRHEKLATSLASQAAVALNNSRLYENIRQLFEGFVKASVTAIESRDPTTSGHSFRVAELTTGLAAVVDRSEAERFRQVRFSPDEIMEIRYASLLHDFGKVGVREQVLVKANKLYPAELDRIRQRVELLKRTLELRYAQQKLEHLIEKGRDGFGELTGALDAELTAALAELDRTFGLVAMANEPAVLPTDIADSVARLSQQAILDHLGNQLPVVTPDEARVLAIPKGSLTREEYREIQQHVVHTFQFLAQIPWTKEFGRVPEIARSHHELMNGAGYPYGLQGEQIPVQSRMMTISDIYDALTASDRPYKKAIPVTRALDILQHERKAGSIDGELLDLFIEAKVYELTISK